MIHPEIPDWLRSTLVTVSVASFLPQLQRITSRRSCAGLSRIFVLSNLISATEQFTIFFYALVNTETENVFVKTSPPSTGDWLNFSQTAAVWLLFLALFALALYSSHQKRLGWIYATFLPLSVVPLVLDAALPPLVDRESRKWMLVFFYMFHTMLVVPLITVFNLVAVCSQARLICTAQKSSALSLPGLFVQAVVFSLVALSWIWRVPFPWERVDYLSLRLLSTWYGSVGWIAVDNGIFGLGRALLLVMALRRGFRKGWMELEGETKPLLADGGYRGYTS
ncbi:uncharacterized protein BJX67DRAFT_210239 [Aspergillus lucknowensis]|uniref:Uncharacterized protein n=1 Tax=Aspergillus lucknowensis TaxID=176173 RepID=A0ABR4M2R0_9EURO